MFEDGRVLEMMPQLIEDGAKAAASPLWPLADAQVVDCLRTAHHLEQLATTMKVRLVHEAANRGVPARSGHRSTTGWLRAELLLDRGPAQELNAWATSLPTDPTLMAALIDGTLDARQAAVIATTVKALPSALAEAAEDREERPDPEVAPSRHGDVVEESSGPAPTGNVAEPEAGPTSNGTDPSDLNAASGQDAPPDPIAPSDRPADRPRSPDEVVGEARAALLARAREFPAGLLRKLGDRILAHVAPEVAERADERALQRQEARARRARRFTLSQPCDGQVRLHGTLSVEDAAVLGAALQPLCAPISGDDRTPAQRRADALVDICRLALAGKELPEQGGEPTQMTVTVPYEMLAARLGVGTLDNGERLSAATVRRLACDAHIIPAVLGGAGQLLDVGRSRRPATTALRRALALRDRGCAFPGCDRPPTWCDAHHLHPWSAGGRTSLDNLVLLCRHHHTAVHDPGLGWRVRLAADHLPEFIPPPWTDPTQRPRRNHYHPRA